MRYDMLAVICFACGAAPGEPCSDLRLADDVAQPIQRPHAVRRRDAEAAGHEPQPRDPVEATP